MGLLHLCTLARSHNEAEDAAQYIVDVTGSDDLFHPNHLFFSAVNWVNYRVWTAFGYAGNAAVPMQLVSAAAGLVSLYLIYRIALRVGATPQMALAAVGWTAFSFGFWVYSLEGDTYLVPIPFVLLSILLLLELGSVGHGALTRGAVARLAGLGLLSAAAALLHQQYVFLIPIVSIAIVLIWRHDPGRRASSLIAAIGIYASTAIIVVAAGYIAVGVFVLGYDSAFEVIGWARGHASNGMWEAVSPKTPVLVLVGFVRSVFSINFLFHSPRSADLIAKAFPGKSLAEERYLAEYGISTPGFVLIILAMIAAVVAAGWLVLRLSRRADRGANTEIDMRQWVFARFAVVYLIVNSFVITIWEPDNPEFWVAVLPVLAILLASRLSPRKRVIAASFVLVVALFVANFFGAVWPYSRTGADYWSMQNRGFAELVRKGDVIVTECPYVCRGNLALMTDVHPIAASSDAVDRLAAALVSSENGRVLVSSWAFDAPATGEEPAGSGKVRAMLNDVRDQMIEIGRSGDQVIYQIPQA
ncbi:MULTISPECIES: hypothetical protein [unclassified Mycolicibacterium]|uniref:hypothetical protein n=1 Tax=unclassified Mycolicibacterium TaxID=2636767 RepID=UPI0012DCB855|nr:MULTISPECIES: hypothetical protein [unclassified Mycolicibacterium]MUL80865.1 cytochrome d ubiquinol oxidase subunit II [Mycolicibacterium sp. CBMA 329]MUL86631.1 cytochrome d ubiquinol oxidase subunit II [Mycolicibacterium sp. CBMA 331]MUM02835.1 cytochrome d ubiquinol oxidase subunit II [Mycolicibacterium sp. CBMA 334]MUM27673.1 cytochrome d ubiquinol oxidase subunit II [Mycolicibacterium sp. CBMA 295]MUM36928.1 cytochrome d ubiquinol oxidase subunit II [Mycolicibacterium sp. CBMA 247]